MTALPRHTLPEAPVGGGAELIEFRTRLTAGEVTRCFRDVLERVSKRVEFARLCPQTNPFDEFEDPATFSAVCTLDGLLNGWAVQIHVFDHGDFRDVRLVILGTAGMERMIGGPRSYSRGAGRTNAAQVMQALTARDDSLVVF
jgi:hypothetical protein